MDVPILETERLWLRPLTAEDAPAIEAHVGLREIAATTLTIPHPYPPGAAAEFIAAVQAEAKEGTGCAYGVRLKPEGTLIGVIGLTIAPRHHRAEVGYWIGRAYWGQGLATEAVGRAIRFAFEGLGLNRVWACHFTGNPASGRVMQKAGMRFEGIMRQHVQKWDRFEDLAVYGVLRADWEAQA